MQYRPTLDLINILAAGGGVEVDATFRPTDELIRMAAAAKQGGSTLILRGMNHRPTLDMLRVASAGKGKVIFSA